ncbi:MAG: DUF2088 domain-containing protein [Proteobacteria bacterium]|nr:DUF2088 domain-containing protein [Pseudomonadota bacterium]
MVDLARTALAGLPRGLTGVAIAVPDATRDVDVAQALAALAEFIDDATVVVGLGLHRKTTAAERAALASPFPVIDHDPDACVALGEVDGIPVAINPVFVDAQAVISVGIVELHQYAGFSGGAKGVVVGCGARQTLAGLHRRELVCHPDVQVGRVEGNPFRGAIDRMGELIGIDLALQQLPDRRWVAGPPAETLRAGAAAQDCWYEAEPVDSVLLRVPAKKAANIYQASRAATYLGLSSAPPLRPGATIHLEAACPEGIGRGSGERAFGELIARTPHLPDLLTGPVPSGAGLQRAYMLARLVERGFHLRVVGCETADELRACGIDATREPAPECDLVVDEPFRRLPRAPASAGAS